MISTVIVLMCNLLFIQRLVYNCYSSLFMVTINILYMSCRIYLTWYLFYHFLSYCVSCPVLADDWFNEVFRQILRGPPPLSFVGKILLIILGITEGCSSSLMSVSGPILIKSSGSVTEVFVFLLKI